MLHNITNATGCSMAPPRPLLGCSSLNSALAARRRMASLMISINAAVCNAATCRYSSPTRLRSLVGAFCTCVPKGTVCWQLSHSRLR